MKPLILSGVVALAAAALHFGSLPAPRPVSLPPHPSSSVTTGMTAGPGAALPAADPGLVRLVSLLDDFSARPVEVLADGVHHPVSRFTQTARGYLAREFEPGEDPADWVREHAHLSPRGSVMYFRYADGTSEPVRDAFLRELDASGGLEK